jgi:hypothetical protein
MRNWSGLFLAVCILALCAGLFAMERRISALETELAATRSELAAAPKAPPLVPNVASSPERDVLIAPLVRGDGAAHHPELLQIDPERPTTTLWQLQEQPSPSAPRIPQRAPSGEINGVPFYVIPLGTASR